MGWKRTAADTVPTPGLDQASCFADGKTEMEGDRYSAVVQWSELEPPSLLSSGFNMLWASRVWMPLSVSYLGGSVMGQMVKTGGEWEKNPKLMN